MGMMVAVDSAELDIHYVGHVAKKMSGFGLSSCQNPPCIHLCTTLQHVPHIEEVLEALQFGAEKARQEGRLAKSASGGAEIYGLADGSGTDTREGSVAQSLSKYVDQVLDM